MDKVKELARKAWTKYRSWPMWGQILGGFLLFAAIISPFTNANRKNDDAAKPADSSSVVTDAAATTTEATAATTAVAKTTTTVPTTSPRSTTTRPSTTSHVTSTTAASGPRLPTRAEIADVLFGTATCFDPDCAVITGVRLDNQVLVVETKLQMADTTKSLSACNAVAVYLWSGPVRVEGVNAQGQATGISLAGGQRGHAPVCQNF